MQLQATKRGDIIIQSTEYSVVPHSLIWIGGSDRCVVEASEGNMFGVRLEKRRIFQTPEYVNALPYNRVYRCNNEQLASAAATCAERWAADPDNKSHIHPDQAYRTLLQQGKKAILKTPYRMRTWDKQDAWTETDGVFAMARAFMREAGGMPLSANKSIGCAGLVIYCYQVASLKVRYGDKLPTNHFYAMAEFVTLKNVANLAWIAKRKEIGSNEDLDYLQHPDRKGTAEFNSAAKARTSAKDAIAQMKPHEKQDLLACLAPAVHCDAASTRTNGLEGKLKDDSKNFSFIGYLVGNKEKGASDKVGIVAGTYAPASDEAMTKALSAASGWM